jgi:hypothetical protein
VSVFNADASVVEKVRPSTAFYDGGGVCVSTTSVFVNFPG